MTFGPAGGSLGKRRLKKYENGSAVPVRAIVHSTKKPQRGQTVGRVKLISSANPPQPEKNINNVEARKGRKEWVERRSIGANYILDGYNSSVEHSISTAWSGEMEA